MDGAVSIGRNIGNTPMDGQQWRQFVKETVGAIQKAGGTVYAKARGKGKWEGIPEQNAVVTFAGVTDEMALTETLQKLRVEYSQDAIALLVGSLQLVSA